MSPGRHAGPGTRVKICGITSLKDALACAEAGADALGFNFYEKSPRSVTVRQAAEIIRRLPPLLARVAVLVNPSQRLVEEILSSARVDWLQMHGDEDFDFMSRFPWSMQIKAARISKKADLKGLRPFAACAGFLLDSAAAGQAYGGAGKAFDWSLALEAKKLYPGMPLILAGGLNPENVAQAVEQVRPWAVDVASGVESAPGKKDIKKVKAFIEAAKGRAYGEEKK